jgi:hypothetical protein
MKKRVSCGAILVLVILVGFAASELGIWMNGKYRPISASQACPTLNMTAMPGNAITFKKSLYVRSVCLVARDSLRVLQA